MKNLVLAALLAFTIVSANGQADPLQTWNRVGPNDPALQGAYLTAGIARGHGQLLVAGFRYLGTRGTTILTRSLNSAPNTQWVERGSTMIQEDVRGVVFANEMFVTWGATGISTSPDGDNWVKRASNVFVNILAYGSGKFVALGSPQKTLTSNDGMSWEVRDSATNPLALYGIAFGNAEYVAVGFAGSCEGPITNTIINSVDGTNWTRVYSQIAYDTDCGGLQSVAFGRDRFVAVGGWTILVSTDGLHWVKRAWDKYLLHQIVYGNGQFVAAGGGDNIEPGSTRFYSSRDGIEWVELKPNFDPGGAGSLAFTDGYFMWAGMEMVLQSAPIINLVPVPSSSHGSLSLSLEAPSGLDYTLQSSTDLASWTDVKRIPASSLDEQILDGLPLTPGHVFWRVRSP